MIRNYQPKDAPELLRLWNTAGAAAGYVPMDAGEFREKLLDHPDFSPEYTFLLEENGILQGFVNGCTGDHIPKGDLRGYVSCLLLKQGADSLEHTAALLEALENAFRKAGRTYSVSCFWCPIRFSWVIPGTEGHQHNNAPGVGVDLPLYGRMLSLGYREAARETAMYRDLRDYQVPEKIKEKAAVMGERGYTVERYDPRRHTGLKEMLAALENPMWSSEIPEAAEKGMEVLVALEGNTCAGFTGPIYPEKSGRGYFAGIGVAPKFQRKGLATLLFYRLLEREKAAGASYMSLFTGENNPARQIYLDAGFREARAFGVMMKEL